MVGSLAPLPAVAACSWLLPDVSRYVFYLVWVCSLPVHADTILALIRQSAAGVELGSSEAQQEEELLCARSERTAVSAAHGRQRDTAVVSGQRLKDAVRSVLADVVAQCKAAAALIAAAAAGASEPSTAVVVLLTARIASQGESVPPGSRTCDVCVVETEAPAEAEVVVMQPTDMSMGAAEVRAWQAAVYRSAVAAAASSALRSPPGAPPPRPRLGISRRQQPHVIVDVEDSSACCSSSGSGSGSDVEVQATGGTTRIQEKRARTCLDMFLKSELPRQRRRECDDVVIVVSDDDDDNE